MIASRLGEGFPIDAEALSTIILALGLGTGVQRAVDLDLPGSDWVELLRALDRSTLKSARMKAVSCREGRLGVVELADTFTREGAGPDRSPALWICGSDLHARHHCDSGPTLAARLGYEHFTRSDQAVVFGHEFCGEVAEHGPGCREASPAGTPRGRAAAVAQCRRRRYDRSVDACSRRLCRADARRGVADDAGPQRPGARCRGADRAAGGRPGTPCAAARSASAPSRSSIGCGPVGLSVICC